jgi:hypothetical protein
MTMTTEQRVERHMRWLNLAGNARTLGEEIRKAHARLGRGFWIVPPETVGGDGGGELLYMRQDDLGTMELHDTGQGAQLHGEIERMTAVYDLDRQAVMVFQDVDGTAHVYKVRVVEVGCTHTWEAS